MPFFAGPIREKLVSIVDLKRRGNDGQPLVDLCDVADLNEILMVDAENSKRAHKAAERKAKNAR